MNKEAVFGAKSIKGEKVDEILKQKQGEFEEYQKQLKEECYQSNQVRKLG